MMPFSQFEQAALAIPYQCKHSRFLYALVRWLRPKSVVEVGTHIGATAVWLASGLQENGDGGILTYIDNFCWREEPTQQEQWCGNINACNVGSAVRLVIGRSQEVQWPDKVDMAYIDGNHTYPVCKSDTLWAISLGATLLAMHDTVSWEGSRRWAEEFRECNIATQSWDILEENSDCGLMICKKREPKGPCEGPDIGEKWDKP